jgi:hypothetical protein
MNGDRNRYDDNLIPDVMEMEEWPALSRDGVFWADLDRGEYRQRGFAS